MSADDETIAEAAERALASREYALAIDLATTLLLVTTPYFALKCGPRRHLGFWMDGPETLCGDDSPAM